MILSVGQILSIGLISSVVYKFERDDSLRRFHDFVKLLGWGYLPYLVTKSYNHVIIIISPLKCKFW